MAPTLQCTLTEMQSVTFVCAKFCRLLYCIPVPILPGEVGWGGGLTTALLLPGPLLGEQLPDRAVVCSL